MVNVSSDVRLPSVQLDEPPVVSSRQVIQGVVAKNLVGPAALLHSFRRDFATLVTTQVRHFRSGV